MKNKKQIRLEIESELDGEVYDGLFTFRKQSILDQTKIARRKSELCGGMYCVRDDKGKPTGQGIDEFTDQMNYAIAVCETLVEQSPEWFALDELGDSYVLIRVFEEVMEYQNSFRRPTGTTNEESREHDASGEGDRSKKRKKTKSGNRPKKVVDQEVQAALEP